MGSRHVRRAIVLSLAVLLALAVMPASAASTVAARIAFARLLPEGGSLPYTANPDGSDERLVSVPTVSDFGNPAWSPDREWLLIANTFRPLGTDEFLPWRPSIVHPDGSGYRLLEIPDAPDEMYCTVWSGDGSRIFCEVGGESPGVYSVRVSDGGDLRQLTANPFGVTGDRPADISPDGSTVLFIRKKPGPAPDPQPFRMEQFGLFTVRVDGSHERQVTPFGTVLGHEIQGAHWSPDGRTIISTNTHGRLFTVSPDGGAISFVKLAVDGFAFAPNWAPDGSRIIFGRFGPEQEDLYTAARDGSAVRQVTDTPDFEFGPDWR